MLSHALKHCSILPADFAELVEAYFQSLYTDTSNAMGILDQLTENIKAILPADL